MARILVAGSTGFIGKRLVNELCRRGEDVYCLARSSFGGLPDNAREIRGDLLMPLTLKGVFDGIDTAYYLVHSMGGGRSGFEERDRMAANYFREAAESGGVKRVIYLGGLGETRDNLSEHLKSRLEVARILASGGYKTTVLRAAVIIGATGASFELIRHLVMKLPVMITPKWVSTKCQPIAVGNVIDYLVKVLDYPETEGGTFDIGGPDILSYREMMEQMAELIGRKLYTIPVPVLTPKLSSYWVGMFTPVKPSISMPLIEGLENEVICGDNRIREIIPINLTPYKEAVKTALAEERI